MIAGPANSFKHDTGRRRQRISTPSALSASCLLYLLTNVNGQRSRSVQQTRRLLDDLARN